MEIVHTIKDLQAGLSALRAQGKKVGLVPTMGALHAGHASLVKRCVAENDAAVVSVFVNPTQFNDKNDLVKYPRTPEADCRQERGYETIFEGKRYNDLKRCGKLAEAALAAGRISALSEVGDAAYWWPIPTDEFNYNMALDQTKDQNPGY